MVPNWSFRTVLFRVSVNGTHCSKLVIYGTRCSLIGHLGLFCFEFLSVNGTHGSQINSELLIWKQISNHFVSHSYFVSKGVFFE